MLLRLCLDRDNPCLDDVWDDRLERVRDMRHRSSCEPQQQRIYQFHLLPRPQQLVFLGLLVWNLMPTGWHCDLQEEEWEAS
jgi:hypothetical protein